MDGGDGKWIFGALMAALGLLGLFMASRAGDEAFYWTGLAVFLFGVIAVFGLIGKAYRPAHGARHEREEEEEASSPS